MSLAVLADHMASKGRGPDSMLIHMSPREVQGLQALAENHGGSLTINPETGLPEAGFLDKLLPTIIGFALNTFAPGVGTAIGSALGTSAAVGTGIAVGGAQALRTGDIGKGISAGLGAYGGASLGANLAAAGTGAMSSEVGGEALKAAGLTGEAALTAEADQIAQRAIEEKLAASTPFERLSAGADVVKNDPMKYLKANAKPLMYAAGPAIFAGESAEGNMPKTTTGMIAPYTFDPYSGTYTAATPYRAAGGGLMGLANGGMAGYEDDEEGMATGGMGGMFNFAQQSEPVVRMAKGGVPGYANGMLVGDQDVFNYFKGLDQSKLGSGALDTQIAKDMQTYNVSAADIARITGTQGLQGDYEKRFVQAVAKPDTSAQEFLAMTSDVGLQNKALEDALNNAGYSQSAKYALTHNLDDTKGLGPEHAAGLPFYNAYGYTAGSAPGDQGGLEGLYSNINYAVSGLQNKINSGALTVDQAQRLSDAEMRRIGVSMGDVKAATGKDLFSLFTPKKKEDEKKTTGIGGTGGIDGTGGTGTAPVYSTDGTGLGGNLSTVLGLPPGVSGGGNTYVNPNGTITTRPDFSLTTNQVRDAYTKGGGSLGYEPYTPKTIEEFDTKYGSRLTGGSKQSLDYLTGKTK